MLLDGGYGSFAPSPWATNASGEIVVLPTGRGQVICRITLR